MLEDSKQRGYLQQRPTDAISTYLAACPPYSGSSMIVPFQPSSRSIVHRSESRFHLHHPPVNVLTAPPHEPQKPHNHKIGIRHCSHHQPTSSSSQKTSKKKISHPPSPTQTALPPSSTPSPTPQPPASSSPTPSPLPPPSPTAQDSSQTSPPSSSQSTPDSAHSAASGGTSGTAPPASPS